MPEAIARIGTCLNCGYDLRGTGSRACPECGKPFDPVDLSTLGPLDGTPLRPIYRWAVNRVGWPIRIVTAGLVLAVLWYARFPADVRLVSRPYRFLFPLLFWLWGCRLLVQLFLKTCSRDKHYRRRIRLKGTAVACMVLLLFSLCVRFELLSELAMKVSRPFLEQTANEMPFGDHRFANGRWAGVYIVNGGQRVEGVRLYSAEIDAMFTPNPPFRDEVGPWRCEAGQMWCLYDAM